MLKSMWYIGMSLGLVTGAGFGLITGKAGPAGGEPSGTVQSHWISANGMSEGAREELALRSEIAGTLKTISVRTGDPVRAGQLLAVLENATQQAQATVARADLQAAAAQLDQCGADVERSRRLLGKNADSRENYERAVLQLKLAQARLQQAQGRLDVAQADLAKTELRAPWDGQVLRVFDEPGAQVGPASARPILLLADVSRRRVRAFVEELDALHVRVGQRALIMVDGLPSTEFSGRVREVWLRMDRDAPRSDTPGEYQDVYHRLVLIDLENGSELPLNLRVNVRIDIRPPGPQR
jgi:RND family efflux transporter MFP subunit